MSLCLFHNHGYVGSDINKIFFKANISKMVFHILCVLFSIYSTWVIVLWSLCVCYCYFFCIYLLFSDFVSFPSHFCKAFKFIIMQFRSLHCVVSFSFSLLAYFFICKNACVVQNVCVLMSIQCRVDTILEYAKEFFGIAPFGYSQLIHSLKRVLIFSFRFLWMSDKPYLEN